MKIEHVVTRTLERIVNRLLMRLGLVLLLVLLALIAVYHFTVAGLLQLEIDHGVVIARALTGGLFAAAAVAVFAVLYVTRTNPLRKAPADDDAALPRETRIAMLLESVMLGFAMARKPPR